MWFVGRGMNCGKETGTKWEKGLNWQPDLGTIRRKWGQGHRWRRQPQKGQGLHIQRHKGKKSRRVEIITFTGEKIGKLALAGLSQCSGPSSLLGYLGQPVRACRWCDVSSRDVGAWAGEEESLRWQLSKFQWLRRSPPLGNKYYLVGSLQFSLGKHSLMHLGLGNSNIF